MVDRHDREIGVAVAAGIVARGDAVIVAAQARAAQRSPLALLVEQGRLSRDSMASLLAEIAADPTALPFDRADGRGQAPAVDGASATPLASPTGAVGPTDEPAFPVPGWDRYTNPRFLGQGGMGTVFAATDPRLRREVAIKFVRGDNPEHTRRLISEARAQARVSHDRVCKIHEVGEVEGKIYIAMQYIAGQPLGSLAAELTFEQKAMLVRGAAEGLHEAHRAGIIHRDVKPSNILVERDATGALRPYVVDFGLARVTQDAEATLSGTVLGTPRYMAPEQAAGPRAPIDRRADVYSLGATLYHLVTGEPPIPGTSPIEVMASLLTTEPRPPRAVNPDLPLDLEAVIVKCLEKDRAARYDSARALADDLGRFLDGEAVSARAAGAGYRVRKWVAKHRRIVAAGIAALAVVLAALGWAIHTRGEAASRERLARRFTEQVERIEASARYVALSPLHDLRRDRAALRARMAELDREVQGAGDLAAGPGHYALGRGYLALDDDASARDHLEQAWQRGYREPRVAYALAVVLGHLYQQALRAAERIESKELRGAKQRAVERAYREPALGYLAASRGTDVAPEAYVAALRAYYTGDLDGALRALAGLADAPTWFYEAPALRGDVLAARARRSSDKGDVDQARADFAAARQAYAAASAIGESVPAMYRSLGTLEYAALVIEIANHGEAMPVVEAGIAATRRALTALPDDDEALVIEAGLARRAAKYQGNQGGNVDEWLGKALADAQRAIAASPTSPHARMELTRIYRQWGEARQGRSEDPTEQLRNAVAAAEAVAVEHRDPVYYGDLGLIFKIWADYDDQVGADARANRGRAIAAYERALQLDDALGSVWINLAINYFMRAAHPGTDGPDGDLAQAMHALDRCDAITPGHPVALFYRAQVHQRLAQRARARGGDPVPALAHSIETFERAIAISPKLPHLHNGIGRALLDQARDASDRGADPTPLLERAQAAFGRAIAVAPDQGFGYDNMGDVHIARALLRRRGGEDPTADVRAAVAAVKQALARIPNQATFWADLGGAHAVQAAYDLERGADPRPSLAEASEAIRNALVHNAKDPQAQRVLGETRGIYARFQASRQRGSTDGLDDAVRAYQDAVELALDGQDTSLAFARFCREWAARQRADGGDPDPWLTRGMALIEPLVFARPTWADARVQRAGLLLLQAERAASADARRILAAAAATDLTQALAVDSTLARTWSTEAARAEQISLAR